MSEKSQGKGNTPPIFSLVSMVGVYFLIVIFSLWLSPLFLRSGFQAFGETGAFEIKWAICYVVAFLLLSVSLLYIIRKRKRRSVKYLFILSLWLGLFYTFIPLYSAALSAGEWEPLPSPEVEYSLPLDEESVLLLTQEGPLQVKASAGLIETRRWPQVYPLEGGEDIFTVPVIYGCDESRAVYTPSDGRLRVYDPREGFSTIFHLTPQKFPVAAISTPPWEVNNGLDRVTLIFFTWQEYEGRYYGFFDITLPDYFRWSLYGNLSQVVNLSAPVDNVISMAYLRGGEWFLEVYAGEDVFLLNLSSETPLKVTRLMSGLSIDGRITAFAHQGNTTLLGTSEGKLYLLDRGIVKNRIRLSAPIREIVPTEKFGGGSEYFLVLSGRGSLNVVASGQGSGTPYPLSTLFQGLRGDVDHAYLLGNPAGDLQDMEVLVITQGDVFYSPPITLTLGYYPQLLSLLTATILILLLSTWSHWWLLDLIGAVAGAGLITILGISLAPLSLVVLLLALAVYDALAVYRTKHMLVLAESAVESRMPVMLVFPKKRGFKMPRGLGLRKGEGGRREAFFMGLGDIVIPGTLVISSYVYLPNNTFLLGLSFNHFAVILIMAGILIAHLLLIQVLLKGKPQAGLPFLNGGALVGLGLAYLLYII